MGIEMIMELFLPFWDEQDCCDLKNRFLYYCQKTHCVEEALGIAKKSSNNMAGFLPQILAAGASDCLTKYIDIAINLSVSKNSEVRKNAIRSFEVINHNNDLKLMSKIVKVLKKQIDGEYDSIIFRSILNIAFKLYFADNSLEDNILYILVKGTEKKGDEELYSVAFHFAYHTNKFSKKLLNSIIDIFMDVSPEQDWLIQNIDQGIVALYNNSDEEKAICTLESFLIKFNSQWKVKQFTSFCYIVSRNNKLFNEIVTRWFLSRKLSLCIAVRDLVLKYVNDNLQLKYDSEQIVDNNKDYLYLVNKAVGWIFHIPIVAVGLIISVLDKFDEDIIGDVSGVLFCPFLLCYPKAVKEYLDKTKSEQSAKVKKTINKELDRYDKYIADLHLIENIVELIPNQKQREMSASFLNQQSADAQEKAFKDSFLTNLLFNNDECKSYLLYGRKIITYVGNETQASRMEVPLNHFRQSFDLPTFENLDPWYIDYYLPYFCEEGLRR